MLRTFVSVFLLACGALMTPATADTWRIDRDHTEVRFTWDHLGLSRQGGRFTDVEGLVTFDPANPAASTVEVKIAVKSVMTGIKALDELLVRSGEYFLAAHSPAIAFRSTGVRMTGEKTAEVAGDLTINGITKPVAIETRWNFTGDHPLAAINPVYANHVSSGFSATTQILRSDWGLARAIPYVSDEIRISIETEMHREGPPTPSTLQPAPPPATGPVMAPVTAEPLPPPETAVGPVSAPGPANLTNGEPDAGPAPTDAGAEDLPAALEP